jgi:1,4-alpha-glucan branching enzyme
VPELGAGQRYKYEIRTRRGGALLLKADPYAQHYEQRPATASVIATPSTHTWNDDRWMQQRGQQDTLQRAISIYEVHLGSWQRAANGDFLNYRTLAKELLEYVQRLGFTHRRIAASDRASIRRVVGLSNTGILRSDQPFWFT